jgi:hypothetical protein
VRDYYVGFANFDQIVGYGSSTLVSSIDWTWEGKFREWSSMYVNPDMYRGFIVRVMQ